MDLPLDFVVSTCSAKSVYHKYRALTITGPASPMFHKEVGSSQTQRSPVCAGTCAGLALLKWPYSMLNSTLLSDSLCLPTQYLGVHFFQTQCGPVQRR